VECRKAVLLSGIDAAGGSGGEGLLPPGIGSSDLVILKT
jgi:hypothetical protein